jgi:carboxyl-terminal processing protease
MGNQHAIGRAQGNDTAPPPEAEQAFQSFWQVYNLIQRQYIDDVDVETLVDGATKGMVDALGDQYSGYMTPEEFDLINSDISGEFNGIGVIIHTDEETGEVVVVGLLEGAPAAEAGIQPGDVFHAVDGVEVQGMNQTELATRVRGEAGTEVTITVRRGEDLLDFPITRAHLTVQNVESRVLDNDMGYIKLNQFTASARADIDAALESIDVNNRRGLILDLRDDPGGLLSSAIDIASAFIKEGVVVTEAFSDDNQETYNANGDYADIQVPIAVLVNGGSASASELLAGALQDRDIATIIGTTTLGKGTVQNWQSLVNGGGVRLTIAKWLTPNGRWIHEEGITPDITVEWQNQTFAPGEDDPQLDAAVQFLESAPTTTTVESIPATLEVTQ